MEPEKKETRWSLFKKNHGPAQVIFLLLIIVGCSLQGYWAATAFFSMLILIIVIGNEKHYRELTYGRKR